MIPNKDLKPGGGLRSSFWDESCVPFMIVGRELPAAAHCVRNPSSKPEFVIGLPYVRIVLIGDSYYRRHYNNQPAIKVRRGSLLRDATAKAILSTNQNRT